MNLGASGMILTTRLRELGEVSGYLSGRGHIGIRIT